MSNLDRKTLAQFLPNRESIAAFEKLFKAVGVTLPDTIEEANALAGQALAAAQVALSMLARTADTLAQLESAPAVLSQADVDDTAPRSHLGTMAPQNHDSVAITGGVINLDAGSAAAPSFSLGGDSTSGLYRSAQDVIDIAIAGAKLLELAAQMATITGSLTVSKQLISTVAIGTPPLVVTSTTNVPNLNASSLNGATFASPGAIGATAANSGAFTTFGCNGKAPQASAALGAAATDLASVITLTNNIRAALIANGIGS